MAWCPCDSSFLLTCSKDNRTLCWDTGSGEVCDELLRIHTHLSNIKVANSYPVPKLYARNLYCYPESYLNFDLQNSHVRDLQESLEVLMSARHIMERLLLLIFISYRSCVNCQPVATGTLMCNGRPAPLVFCRPHHLMGKLESITLRYSAVECVFAFLTGIGV
jgi:hypothetical protein